MVKIKRFQKVIGAYIENIAGQNRFGFSKTDTEEFFEIPSWINKHGYYAGAIIHIYDLMNGKVYTPFQLDRNVTYSDIIYNDSYYYFLKADFNKQFIYLYKYYPDSLLEEITHLSMEDVNLYNLRLTHGNQVHITSDDDLFVSYYPERFSLDLKAEQSVIYIDSDKIYLNEWVEQGIVDDEITADYQYFDKTILIDKKGNILSEEIGSLSQYLNDEWWLS